MKYVIMALAFLFVSTNTMADFVMAQCKVVQRVAEKTLDLKNNDGVSKDIVKNYYVEDIIVANGGYIESHEEIIIISNDIVEDIYANDYTPETYKSKAYRTCKVVYNKVWKKVTDDSIKEANDSINKAMDSVLRLYK